MFDVQTFLAPLAPHIETVRDTCNQWGEAIVTRLDAIHYAVLADDIEEARQRVSVGISPADGRKVIAEVPGGHDWLLESWFANLTTPGAFIIRNGDEPVFGKTLTGNVDSGGGNDLTFIGRTTMTIEAPVAVGRVYLTFRRRLPGVGRARRFGGGSQDVYPASPRVLSPPNEHQPAYPLDPDRNLVRQ